MSDYQVTSFAIAKVKNQNLTYEEVWHGLNLDEDGEDVNGLSLREDPYDSKDIIKQLPKGRYGTMYLFVETSIPTTVDDLEDLINDFRKHKDLIDMTTFDIRCVMWYNGSDMPLSNL